MSFSSHLNRVCLIVTGTNLALNPPASLKDPRNLPSSEHTSIPKHKTCLCFPHGSAWSTRPYKQSLLLISRPSETLTHIKVSRTERKKNGYLQQINLLCQRSLLRTRRSLSVACESSEQRDAATGSLRIDVCPLTTSLESPSTQQQPALLAEMVPQQSGRKANTENFPRWLQQLAEPMRHTKLKIPNTNRMIYLNKNINTDELIFPKPS